MLDHSSSTSFQIKRHESYVPGYLINLPSQPLREVIDVIGQGVVEFYDEIRSIDSYGTEVCLIL